MRKTKVNVAVFTILLIITVLTAAYGVYSVYSAYANASGDISSTESGSVSGYKARSKVIEINGGVRAFYVKADDICSENPDEDKVRLRCDSVLDSLVAIGFNTIIMDTKRLEFNDFIFPSGYTNYCGVNALKIMMEAAAEREVTVYPVYYINSPVLPSKIDYSDSVEYKKKAFLSFCKEFSPKGVIVTDYYAEITPQLYYRYKQSGFDGKAEDYLAKENTDGIKEILSGAKNVAKGLLVDPVWANFDENSEGIKAEGKSALKDGFTDTKALVAEKACDFLLVRAPGSLTDKKVPFKTVVLWWDTVASKAGLQMLVLHDASKLLSNEEGWQGADQLVRQVSVADKLESYAGSVFEGYDIFSDNPEKSTDLLMEYYQKNYSDSDLFKNLEMISPKEQNFETSETTVRFHGKFDPKNDVLINGIKINPSKSGEFIADYPLEIGDNSFVFSHKGQKVTYRIKRTLTIIKSVSPAENITVAGGSQVIIKAKAYKGAKLSAVIAGQTVSLSESAGSDENDLMSSYVTYGGVFRAPAAGSSDKSLGNVKIVGSYHGTSETKSGGAITVLAAVQDYSENYNSPAAESGKTGQSSKLMGKTSSYGYGTRVEFIHDNTVIYDGDVSGAGYGSPQKHTLPAGTIDYIESKVTEYFSFDSLGKVDFYKLRSGKKVKVSDVKKATGKSPGNNKLSDIKIKSDSNYTTISMNSKWKAGYDISFDGLKYTVSGEFLYCVNSFNPSSITVSFDYADSFPKLPKDFLKKNPLFSSASFVKTVEGSIPKVKLHLKLKNAGEYYGCTVFYTGSTLNFQFVNPKGSLSGVKVVLDPGHGKGDLGAVGSYEEDGKTVIVYERDLNLKMANEIKTLLEAEGAQVYVYDSENDSTSKTESLSKRVAFGRSKAPMIYLSIHHNSAGSSTSGVESFYTNPFSKPLAQSVNNALANYYHNSMYPGSSNKNRQDKYGEYYVTRVHEYAATLVEYGYMSNPTELKKLNSKKHRKGLAKATVEGFKVYLSG